MTKKKKYTNKKQLELNLDRPKEKDRNHHLGGKSFYFFDFDDNIISLATPIIIFHKKTHKELPLSSEQWAQNHREIGKSGNYVDYFIDLDDHKGSFRHFRDHPLGILGKVRGKKQKFLRDIQETLNNVDLIWKAPSWNCFYHATYNHRPVSIITARGHNSQTIKKGINLLVNDGHLPHNPNFLSIYPVTNPQTRKKLGDNDFTQSVANLKRTALSSSVERAIKLYGYNPHHRFGMSDDDPKNVELITEEMKLLKRKYPEMSFFVIHTLRNEYIKNEIH